MFTKLPIIQRIQVGLILLVAFLLVLGSNRLDQRHFDSVQNTVNSVYKDRVVVQNYIFQLSDIFKNKKFNLLSNKPNASSENRKVTQLLVDFGDTKLTKGEAKLLNDVDTHFKELQSLEEKSLAFTNEDSAKVKDQIDHKLDRILVNLASLSQIQLSESEEMTKLSNKSLGMNNLLSKLEMAFLIFIGILLLLLIFYPDQQAKEIS